MNCRFPTNMQRAIDWPEDPDTVQDRNNRIEDLCDQLKALEAVKQSIDFARTAVGAAGSAGVTFDRYSRLREALDDAEAAVLEEIKPRAENLRAYREGEMP